MHLARTFSLFLFPVSWSSPLFWHFSGCVSELRMGKRLMRSLVVLIFFLTLWETRECNQEEVADKCQFRRSLKERPHSVSILEFGAIGDGTTLNTVAFQNAIFYLKSFADKGGAQLYVPPGRWLTGCLRLTSHLTLFLEKDAVILGTQDYNHWPVVDPLPSYGRGLDLPGRRYSSLITGNRLKDVVITGNNGTISGQGSVWWDQYTSGSLQYSRPNILEFINSIDIVISNITLSNPPAWSIHPVYCNNVLIENITIHSPPESPYTSGIVPDSSDHVCIGYSNISMGHDAVAVKSGWDQYGIAYNKSTSNLQIESVRLQSFSGAGLAFGSEMSGGISGIVAKELDLKDSLTGIALRTSIGRGGYIEDLIISDVVMDNVHVAIKANGESGSHPDDRYDPKALPVVKDISFLNMVGTNISISGSFTGIDESPFTSIFLSNITFQVSSIDTSSSWVCSNVFGSSSDILPEPCPELERISTDSLSPFSILDVKIGNKV